MRNFVIITMISLLIGLTGCAGMGIQNPDGTPLTPEEYFNRYETIFQLGVQVGIIHLLEVNPKYADRVDKFSKYMLDYIEENKMLDLTDLEEVVRNKIDWSTFDPTERLLVETLITTVKTELTNILTANGVTVPDAPEKVKFYSAKFFTWVGQAVQIFEAQRNSRSPVPVLP